MGKKNPVFTVVPNVTTLNVNVFFRQLCQMYPLDFCQTSINGVDFKIQSSFTICDDFCLSVLKLIFLILWMIFK